jgi:hypothetical protein
VSKISSQVYPEAVRGQMVALFTEHAALLVRFDEEIRGYLAG